MWWLIDGAASARVITLRTTRGLIYGNAVTAVAMETVSIALFMEAYLAEEASIIVFLLAGEFARFGEKYDSQARSGDVAKRQIWLCSCSSMHTAPCHAPQ